MPDTMIAAPSPVTGMPAEIAKAIGEVMAQVRSLPKGERNDHGGYNFASIDDFLSFVGPLCSTAGLIVYQDEHSIDMIDRGGKGWVKATYAFRLGHTSGVICERPMLRTVFQAITGPQTMGSSQSYSLKQFLRSLFMIPTGDRDDADYHKPQDMPAAEGRQKAVQQAEQPRRHNPPSKPAQAAPAAPSDDDEPRILPIMQGNDGPLLGRWTKAALEVMEGKPLEWRQKWLELHQVELGEVRWVKPEFVARIEVAASAPDDVAE